MRLTLDTIGVWLARLAEAGARVLILDYDGTLAPFTPQRDRAQPYPGVVEALLELRTAGHTRLVFATGRPVPELLRLLPLTAECECWGCHGLQRRFADGRQLQRPLPPQALAGLNQARAAARRLGWLSQVEQKPGSLALHWRGLPDALALALHSEAEEAWDAFTADGSLQLLRFEAGLELRTTACSKADIVAGVLAESASGAAIAYLGDDATDEDAFAALGDRGLSILVRTQFRPTRAQAWLQPPEELLTFFNNWSMA